MSGTISIAGSQCCWLRTFRDLTSPISYGADEVVAWRCPERTGVPSTPRRGRGAGAKSGDRGGRNNLL